MQRGVDTLYRVCEHILQRVEQSSLLLAAHIVDAEGLQPARNVALLNHEAHEHILVGQLLLVGLGIEAVEHIVVLNGGV